MNKSHAFFESTQTPGPFHKLRTIIVKSLVESQRRAFMEAKAGYNPLDLKDSKVQDALKVVKGFHPEAQFDFGQSGVKQITLGTMWHMVFKVGSAGQVKRDALIEAFEKAGFSLNRTPRYSGQGAEMVLIVDPQIFTDEGRAANSVENMKAMLPKRNRYILFVLKELGATEASVVDASEDDVNADLVLKVTGSVSSEQIKDELQKEDSLHVVDVVQNGDQVTVSFDYANG